MSELAVGQFKGPQSGNTGEARHERVGIDGKVGLLIRRNSIRVRSRDAEDEGAGNDGLTGTSDGANAKGYQLRQVG